MLDASLAHIGNNARGDESLVKTAITIWCDSNLGLALQKDLAVIGDARQYSLLKNDHVLLIQSKIMVLLKEIFRRPSCRSAGHDIPWNNDLVFTVLLHRKMLDLTDPLRLKLE